MIMLAAVGQDANTFTNDCGPMFVPQKSTTRITFLVKIHGTDISTTPRNGEGQTRCWEL